MGEEFLSQLVLFWSKEKAAKISRAAISVCKESRCPFKSFCVNLKLHLEVHWIHIPYV